MIVQVLPCTMKIIDEDCENITRECGNNISGIHEVDLPDKLHVAILVLGPGFGIGPAGQPTDFGQFTIVGFAFVPDKEIARYSISG